MTFYDPLSRVITVHNVTQWINDRTEAGVMERVAAGQWRSKCQQQHIAQISQLFLETTRDSTLGISG